MADIQTLFRCWFFHKLWGQYSTPPASRPPPRRGYNQVVRFLASLLLILCLAACQHGGQNADAVRQGVIDYLSKANFNVAGMDIKVSSIQFKGDQADASVTVTIKGQNGGMVMPFTYHLEHQNNKWVVVGHSNIAGHGGAPDSPAGGANPHGGAMPPAMPGGDNPHGGGAGKMPAPGDLPPAKK